MSRRQHPLDILVRPFRQHTDLTQVRVSIGWETTLYDNQGRQETANGIAPVPVHGDWNSFWLSVNGQLEWSKAKLNAAPIVELINDADTIEYVAAVPLTNRFKGYFTHYPDLHWRMQELGMVDFAAVVHLCKIKYHRMQMG